MPFWKAGKNDDQVLDELKETQKQNADEFVKKQEHADEAQKSSLIIDNNFTPVEYDPQYILQVNHLKKYFPIKGGMVSKTVGYVKAVDGVTFNLKRGTTMGLVGESGCGKTTTGRTLLRLYEPTDGTIIYDGKVLFDKKEKIAVDMLPYRRRMQIVFQDPYASLDPRMTIGDIVGEGIDIHHLCANAKERHDKIISLLERVGLNSEHANRYPHEFSGGQRQRIGIARALIMNPKLIIADECISALDVSIQAQVVNLMKDIQQETGTAYLFIAHDLSMVKYISDRIGVLHLGHLLETGTTEEIFANPIHPYTRSLLSAIPLPNPVVEKRRVAETYDYATSGIDYSKGTSHLVSGSHYVKCTDEEFAKWCK